MEHREIISDSGLRIWEGRGQRTEDRFFKALNIEQQNKEPLNDEVVASIFPPEADSIFCGSKRRQL
jgi:hypothetical protein